MRNSNHLKCRGTSLIELMVASTLVGLIMMQLWALVASGSRFYLKAKSQGDIQRNSLLALRWISKDMSEGSSISFRRYAPPTTTRTGISFGSPQNGTGGVNYDKGRLLWSSVLGYYIETDGTLYRQQRLITPVLYPPVINSSSDSPDILAALPNPRVVARQVKDLIVVQAPDSVQITLHVRDTQLGFGIQVQTRMEMKN